MIPSELFHDLLDKNVAFRIIQRNLNGPDYEFSVPHPKDGMVLLKAKGCETLVGYSHAILGRINALMCQRPSREAPSLSADDVYLDTGLVIDFKIVPEPARGKQAGFPEEIQVDGTILYGDYPNAILQHAFISVVIAKKERLYLTELDGESLHERFRISHRSIPKDIHGRLVSAGTYDEESFVKIYGLEALEEAQESSDAHEKEWRDLMHKALGRK
jgi:hypothetical protein